jgi:hypothetical protein
MTRPTLLPVCPVVLGKEGDMSFDLCVRSDASYKQRAERASVLGFVVALPRVIQHSSNHVLLEHVTLGVRMEIDLELVSEEGDFLDGDESDQINCVRIHVPYACAEAAMPWVHEVCFAIAGYVGWNVFDEQRGEYLDLPAGGRNT